VGVSSATKLLEGFEGILGLDSVACASSCWLGLGFTSSGNSSKMAV
jgi:hypothetical protein